MTLKKIRKLTVKANKKLNNYLSDPVVPGESSVMESEYNAGAVY